VTNGNDEAAQAAFVRLLVLAPATVLSSESSPRVRTSFDAAAKQLATDGAITATMSPLLPAELSGPVSVEVAVSDPLRRVAGVRVELVAGEQRGVVPLAAGEATQAMQTYRGTIEPIDGVTSVDWQVVAIGQSGTPIDLREPVGGHYEQVSGSFPIIPVAAAVGVVVVGAATVAGVLVYRNMFAPTIVKVEIQ
jgi:hypothetical protein